MGGATITSIDLSALSQQSQKPLQLSGSESKRVEQEITRPTQVVGYYPEMTYTPTNVPPGLEIMTSFSLPQTNLKLGPITFRQVSTQPTTPGIAKSVCDTIRNATAINIMKKDRLTYYLGQLGYPTGGGVKELKETLKRACGFSS